MFFARRKSLRTACVLLLVFGLAACGGGGNGGGSGSAPITVSGIVFDISGVPVALAGATVTLRAANGASLSSTTSAVDGFYSLVVPASTRVYVATSKSGYVNCNSRIIALSASDTHDVILLSPSAAKVAADAVFGSVGGSSWTDAFYSQKSWYGLDFLSRYGNDVPGLDILVTPGDATVAYNNGSDLFSATPPTKSSNQQPLVGGYSASTGTHAFVNNFNQVVELPLNNGEVSYSLFVEKARSVTWSAVNSGTTNTLFGIAASGSSAVAVGSLGTIITSSDGNSWMPSASGVNAHLNGVATSTTQFVAVGDLGTIITSSDLITWTSRTSGTANRLRGVAWTGSQFISVGDSGTILTSPDGVTWTPRTSGTPNDLYGVTGNGSQNIAVGAGSTILTSQTGSAWTPRTSQAGSILHSIVWSGVQFLIGGDSGALQTSFDGITWTRQRSVIGNDFTGVAWSGSQFIAVAGGLFGISPDGISWTLPAPLDVGLNSVTWFKGHFIGVGFLGAIVLI
jgi:hypothetical protein